MFRRTTVTSDLANACDITNVHCISYLTKTTLDSHFQSVRCMFFSTFVQNKLKLSAVVMVISVLCSFFSLLVFYLSIALFLFEMKCCTCMRFKVKPYSLSTKSAAWNQLEKQLTSKSMRWRKEIVDVEVKQNKRFNLDLGCCFSVFKL